MTLRFYRAKDGWRWQLLNNRNKKLVAESGEGYKRRIDCRRMAFRVLGLWDDYTQAEGNCDGIYVRGYKDEITVVTDVG